MIYLLLLTGLIMPETQAVFAPANSQDLQYAVGICHGSWLDVCRHGCLGETPDGSCPTFAASHVPGTVNPYGAIGDWDVSRVEYMGDMFFGSPFNGDISKWNTGAVADMGSMFAESQFNGDISKWNTGGVESMRRMFENSAFNSDLSKWNTGAVFDMDYMFAESQFNGDLSKWNTGKVDYMSQMFHLSSFKRTLCGGKWDSLSSNSNLTSTGRLGCCPAGSFMSDPIFNPFSVANSCHQCPLGYFGSDTTNDDTQCLTCEPGKYSSIGSSSCATCTGGTFSIGGAGGCSYSATTCPAGTYASGAAACQPCSAGMYNAQSGGTCAVCSADKYSTTIGRTTDCDQSCPAGTYISDTTTATKHDEESDCRLCSFENELVGCTDDEWQQIKVFYNNRPSCPI